MRLNIVRWKNESMVSIQNMSTNVSMNVYMNQTQVALYRLIYNCYLSLLLLLNVSRL